MLSLNGKIVRFRLSPEGEKALRGLFSRRSLQVQVEEVDELGAWIVLDQAVPNGPKTVMLLKWDYFSTAVVEVEQEVPTSERVDIGFRPQNAEEP
jgi:hypothetical protein